MPAAGGRSSTRVQNCGAKCDHTTPSWHPWSCCTRHACIAAYLPAGQMKAPPCGTADPMPFLSSIAELNGPRIFTVQASGAAIPMGSPLAVLSFSRTKGACPAYLSLGSASTCSNALAQMGSANSPGAQQWVLEDAGKTSAGAQLVVVYSAVSGWMDVRIGTSHSGSILRALQLSTSVGGALPRICITRMPRRWCRRQHSSL